MTTHVNALRSRIISFVSVLGGVLLVGGIAVALVGRTANTAFKLFGQEFSSTSVGVSLAFIGAVVIAMTFRRMLGSLDESEKLSASGQTALRVSQQVVGGSAITASSIGTINIGEARRESIQKEKEVVFISEGVVTTPPGFRLAFSIWNNKPVAVKIVKISTVQHIYTHSVSYYGGSRHHLELNQDKEQLWDGDTYEIPPGQSASFDSSYTMRTGPLDGEPWIVIGVVARFHDALGEVQDIHSDCIYQIVKGRVQMVPIAAIETLNSDNTFRHVIYAGLLQSLSDTLDKGRKHIIDLMKEDYTNGITRLQALVKEKGSEQDLERIEVLSKRLLEFTEEEAKGPLQRSDRERKREVEEQLRQESVRFGGRAFVHLCALEVRRT